MAKGPTLVASAPTPSEQLVAAALATVNVTDVQGRVFTLKKPNILAQFRIVEALGELAANSTYMAMVMPLIFVAAIDNDPIPFPTTKRQVEALAQRVDEDGFKVIGEGIREHWGDGDAEEVKDAIKKS